jgi:predicted acylesterase/phospholipase RssA
MAEHILKFWTSIKNQGQFCKKWRGGDFFSLFFRPSIYDNTNERDVIAGSTGTQVMRNISVAATNVNTGEYKDFSEDIGAPAMARACLASGSAPFIFPSIQIGDQWYMDGGVTSNIDVYRAIERCRGWGFDDEDIVMDVVLCTKPVALSHQRVNNTRQAMDRTTDTMRVHNLMWFLDQTFTNFPEVDFRLVQTPSQHMPPNKPGLALDFNPVDIQYGINMGYNDGIKLIKEKNFGRKSIQQHLSQSQVHFL